MSQRTQSCCVPYRIRRAPPLDQIQSAMVQRTSWWASSRIRATAEVSHRTIRAKCRSLGRTPPAISSNFESAFWALSDNRGNRNAAASWKMANNSDARFRDQFR